MTDLEEPAPTADNELRREANEFLKAKEYSRANQIMQRIFDGKDASIANNLGFVHSIKGSDEYDPAKAIEYYLVSAKQGDIYGQHALGWLFQELGEIDEAIRWYREASNGGDGDCSYGLYRLLKERGEIEQAHLALELGAKQGNPLAKHAAAMERMLGRRGVSRIPIGFARWIGNAPAFIKYIAERREAESKSGQ
jgi:TPR repeat protein